MRSIVERSLGKTFSNVFRRVSKSYDAICLGDDLLRAVDRKDADEDKCLDLIRGGASLEEHYEASYKTPLYYAALYGHEKIARALIDNKARLEQGIFLRSPLIAACEHKGGHGIAMMLIDAGADVNASDHEGMTPLMGAASSGNMALVKTLLEKGACVSATLCDICDDYMLIHGSTTAADLARAKGHADIADYLIEVQAAQRRDWKRTEQQEQQAKLDAIDRLAHRGVDHERKAPVIGQMRKMAFDPKPTVDIQPAPLIKKRPFMPGGKGGTRA